MTPPDVDISSPEQFRRLKLTPRWTDLKPHHGQQLFFWHPAPIKVCPSPRRTGKTELSKRKAVLQLVRKRDWPAKVMLGAPTYDQARTIFWDDIRALIPPAWVAGMPNQTRMEIRTKWGAVLRVMGLDRPERAEGTPWDWMVVDELANCAPKLLENHLLPALATVGRTVSCDLIGVPDNVGPNQKEYEKYWELGLQWPKDPNVCSFHWRADEILEPEKLAHARATMDPDAFEQEYGGRFISPGGKAVPRFDVALHVRADYAQYEPYLSLDWTLDFGVDPAASLLCQTYKGRAWVIDELVIPNGSTKLAVEEFLDRCRSRGYSTRRIRVFGDAAGGARSTATGESDYQILEERLRGFNVEWNQLRAAPPVKDTVNAVRSLVVNANNQVRLHVNPQCKKLIEDLKTAPWPDDLRAFHTLAALRYYCFSLGEMPSPVATSTLTLPNLGAVRARSA